MRYFLNKIKAGVFIAPAFIIYLYLFFGLLDLLTTFLASPDLEYEGNWIVRKFNFSWPVLIIYALINYLTTIIAFTLSLEYLTRHLEKFSSSLLRLFLKPLRHVKMILSIILIGLFYSHLINLGHIIINNYLSYVYLHLPTSWLGEVSVWYVERQRYFLFYIIYLTIIPGYLFAFLKIKLLRKRPKIKDNLSVMSE